MGEPKKDSVEIKSLIEGIEGKPVESFDEKKGTGRAEIRGGKKELLYERGWGLNDPSNPDAGRKYDYEKKFGFNAETGFREKEVGQDLLAKRKGNAWSKQFEVNEQGKDTAEIGEITNGPDMGHKWKKDFKTETLKDGTRVDIEHGLVLAQGMNTDKEATGHEWESYNIFDKEGNHLFWGGRHIVGKDGKPSKHRYGKWQEINELLNLE